MVTNDSGTSSKPPKPVKVLAESERNLEKVEEEGVMMISVVATRSATVARAIIYPTKLPLVSFHTKEPTRILEVLFPDAVS